MPTTDGYNGAYTGPQIDEGISKANTSMQPSVYDPQNKAQDVFGYVDSVAEGLIEYVDFTVTEESLDNSVIASSRSFDEVMALLNAGTTVIGRAVQTIGSETNTVLLTVFAAYDTKTYRSIFFCSVNCDYFYSNYIAVNMYREESVLHMYMNPSLPQPSYESDRGKILMVQQNGDPDWSPMPTAGELGALPISGGTMTGPLTLSGDPTEDLQAAPKQYVDALKPKPITITLPASGWSNNQQTVAATGVTADNAVTPSPAPASWEAAGAAGVRCTAQGADSLTFACSETPTEDLTYNVLIQEVMPG